MAEELLSLKWNNHQSHFVDILTYLREKDMFIDATIACGGKVYSAHKFVLSTCSDYFKNIFTRNTSSNPIVFMKDVSSRDIEALLDFMYHGEVNVPQSSLGSLIKTAEGLQIKGLAVPDDPPSARRNQERDKRERDSYIDSSPPPKRRPRDRSPPPSRRSSNHSHSTIGSSSLNSSIRNSNRLPNSPSRNDEDNVKINSVHSNQSFSDSKNASSSLKHSTCQRDDPIEDDRGKESNSIPSGRGEPEAGELINNSALENNSNDNDDNNCSVAESGPAMITSGSKQEEMEIKQEDVVELADDDEDEKDWLGEHTGAADSLGSADNSMFPDMLLPTNADGSLGNPSSAGGSGGGNADTAMAMLLQGVPPKDVALQLYRSDKMCPICCKTFSYAVSMKRHCLSHLPSTHSLHCDICGRSFYRQDMFKKHMAKCSPAQPEGVSQDERSGLGPHEGDTSQIYFRDMYSSTQQP